MGLDDQSDLDSGTLKRKKVCLDWGNEEGIQVNDSRDQDKDNKDVVTTTHEVSRSDTINTINNEYDSRNELVSRFVNIEKRIRRLKSKHSIY